MIVYLGMLRERCGAGCHVVVHGVFYLLSVSLSVCMSVYLSGCLSGCLCVDFSVYLSVCVAGTSKLHGLFLDLLRVVRHTSDDMTRYMWNQVLYHPTR